MSPTVKISSTAEFNTILGTSNVVITDFYADWCGPCKAIAPTFESLSAKHSKPKAVTFTKVDVDSQQEISQKYGVTAMPTFMVFLGGNRISTVRGADPRALTNAVEAAIRSAPAINQIYSTPGRTLGGPGTKPAQSLNRPLWAIIQSWISAIIAFFGLYFATLFSFDSYAAGEKSQFNKHRIPPPEPPKAVSSTSTARPAPPAARKVGTLSDITERLDRRLELF